MMLNHFGKKSVNHCSLAFGNLCEIKCLGCALKQNEPDLGQSVEVELLAAIKASEPEGQARDQTESEDSCSGKENHCPSKISVLTGNL